MLSARPPRRLSTDACALLIGVSRHSPALCLGDDVLVVDIVGLDVPVDVHGQNTRAGLRFGYGPHVVERDYGGRLGFFVQERDVLGVGIPVSQD